MKNRREIVLAAIDDANLRSQTDLLLRDYPKDGAIWLDAMTRVGHVNAIINALDPRLKLILCEREKFAEMLSEFAESTRQAAEEITAGAINTEIYKQLDEQVLSRARENLEMLVQETRAARDRDSVWMNKVFKRVICVIILCIVFNGMAFIGGYMWGASSAKQELNSATSQPAAKSSPFIVPVEEKPRRTPAQAAAISVLATGKTIADAPIIRKSPQKNAIVEGGKNLEIFEFSTDESACRKSVAYRIGPEDWAWICADKVHVLKQNKPIPHFEQ